MSHTEAANNSSDTAIEWLVRLHSEKLSPQEEQQFLQWLESDSANQRAYIEAEWLWARSGTVQATAKQRSDLPARKAKVVPLHKRILPRAMAASVALFLVGLATLLFVDYQNNHYTTEVGEQIDFVLSDGSHLYLNTDSVIHTDLDGKHRLIRLEHGEVFFDVAKDPARPFLVQTNNGIVRVLGTRFNVRNSDEGSTTVTVLEGAVGVTRNSDVKQVSATQFTPELQLAPDQQTTVTDKQVTPARTINNTDKYVAWRDGKLIYDGEPFKQVLQDISRYFEGEIRLGDATLEELKVVAVLQLQDKKSTLKALEETFNLASVETSRELTLLYPKK